MDIKDIKNLKEIRETSIFVLDATVLAEMEIQLIEMVDKFDISNVNSPIFPSVSIDWQNRVRASVSICSEAKHYDNILQNENAAISIYGITCEIIKHIKIKGVAVTLRLYVSCLLPNEDLLILTQLGKVHEEIIPARIERSIFCKVDDIPF